MELQAVMVVEPEPAFVRLIVTLDGRLAWVDFDSNKPAVLEKGYVGLHPFDADWRPVVDHVQIAPGISCGINPGVYHPQLAKVVLAARKKWWSKALRLGPYPI